MMASCLLQQHHHIINRVHAMGRCSFVCAGVLSNVPGAHAKHSAKIYLVFFDEVQAVSQLGTCDKSLRVDLDCDIYITDPTRSCLPANSRHPLA